MPVYKYQTKKGTKYYVKYKNITKRGFESSRKAKLYESELRLNDIDNHNIDNVYFSVLVNDFLTRKEKDVTYGSYLSWHRVVSEIILPNVKNKKILQINERDCLKFRDYVYDLNYATSYKNMILSMYQSVFNYAVKYYKLRYNPSSIIEPFKATFEEKQKKQAKELNVWNTEEFNRFIVCVDDEKYKCLFSILYYTGMRIGELQALQWKDIYNGKIHITKNCTTRTNKGIYEIKSPKNDSSIRNIELGKSLEEILNRYKQIEMTINGYNEDWYIFGRIKPLSAVTITKYKDEAIEKANVKRITLHEFRHSHASNLINSGINIVAVSRRLGHSNTNTTLRTYTHLIENTNKKLIDYIDNCSQNLISK